MMKSCEIYQDDSDTEEMESSDKVKRKHQDENVERGNWAKKTEFFLSLIGYAVGLGNVWRFPYLCYRNGGGAFLVPYLICLFLCGVPLFFLETGLGQFSSLGCITFLKIAPLFKGVGYAMVVVTLIFSSYFGTVICYSIYFLAMSFTRDLPWNNCDNPWNTDACIKLQVEGDMYNGTSSNLTALLASNNTGHLYSFIKTPADEFFHHRILEISEGVWETGTVVWQLLLCSVGHWLIVYFCIINGIKSVGKVVYFSAVFPFIILVVIFIRGITLPGAVNGIMFYITPQWDKLMNLHVWADAAVQIFFSLGPGWGGIINMASYNKFHNEIKRDSLLVPLINSATSIFAGCVVFSVLGFMSYKTGIPVSKVATGGPSLAFVVYPEAITLLPLPPLWAILFFLMFYFVGLDTQFVQLEAIISGFLDEYPKLRIYQKVVTSIICLSMFLMSLGYITNGGIYAITLVDWYCSSLPLVTICLIEVIIVGWIYGMGNFVRDLEFMIGKPIFIWWRICWKFITPVILMLIFVFSIAFNTPVSYNGQVFPEWAQLLGWSTGLSSLICIPVYAVYKIIITPGSLYHRVASNLKPTSDWGPALEVFRMGWKKYLQENPPEWKELGLSFHEDWDPCNEVIVHGINDRGITEVGIGQMTQL